MRLSAALLGVSLIASLPSPVDADAAGNIEFRFKRYSLEQGLSQGSVYAIEQDRRGFLWVGTQDGLNRFDGYRFRVFNHSPFDTTSLSHNRVTSLCADRRGNLWVGTGRGLNLMRFGGETFTRYLNDPLRPESLCGDNITCIYSDSHDVLWIGTEEGLDQFDQGTAGFVHHRYDPEDEHSLCSNKIIDLYEDANGTMWVGTRGGLNRFDRASERFDRFVPEPTSGHGAGNVIRAIAAADDGTLYLGTGAGLLALDIATGNFQRHELTGEAGRQLGNAAGRVAISDIIVDSSGRIWAGTPRGIVVLSPESGDFVNLKHDHEDDASLSFDSVTRLFEDNSEVVWVGTYGYGLNSWSPYLNKFGLYRYRAEGSNGLSFKSVRAIYEEPSGALWVGGYGGGLNRLDPATGEFARTEGVPYGTAYAVLGDPDAPEQLLWIGTEGAGLLSYDVERRQFRRYPTGDSGGSALAGRFVYAMCADPEGRLWIGTEMGINVFDRATGDFSLFDCCPGGRRIRAIAKDRSGAMWVGASGGLARLDPGAEDFVHYLHDPADPTSLSNENVLCVLEDSRGQIWVGTNGGGLNRLNRPRGTFTHYLKKDGLPNNVVYGILEDCNGALWISTNAGISRFDTQSGSFHNYTLGDGLQSLEFNANAYHRGMSGKLYFGGISGLNVIDPDNMREDPHAPAVVLTEFSLSSRPVTPSEEIDGRLLLARPIAETARLELAHSDDIISFELAGLNLAAPSRTCYAYKLEGFEDQWIDIGNRRHITFTNLKPGEYRLLVKGANSDGVWSDAPTSLALTISPPFWQEWWFRCLTLAALGALTLGIYRLRTRMYRRRGAELNRSKDFLNSIINALDDPVIVKDENRRWVVLNDKSCEMLGRPREELLGKDDYHVFLKGQADRFRREDDDAFANSCTVVGEDATNWQGEERIISTKKSVFTQGATGRRYLAWSIRDITGLRHYEDELEERLRFESLVSRISTQLINPPVADIDSVVETGLEEIGKFLAADRVVIRLRKGEQGLPGKVYAWRGDGSQHSQVKEDFEAAFPNLAEELDRNNEVVFDRISDFPAGWEPEQKHMAAIGIRSGVVTPLSVGGALLGSISVLMLGAERSWPENTLARVRTLGETLANAIHRKRADEALRRSQQKYWSILENIGIGIALISNKPEVLELNKKMREWLPDLRDCEIPFCLRSREDRDPEHNCPDCPIARTLRDGTVHETISSSSDGDSVASFRIVASPIQDSNGDTVAAIELVEDITEKQRLEEQLRHSQKMEAIGTLAGGIAHDFNNILYALLGYANLAKRSVSNGSDVHDCLEQIETAGHRASELVEQILAFSRRVDSSKRPIDLRNVVAEALKLLRGSLPTTVEISQSVADDCGSVIADPTQIHQVLMNLCTNALQAMPNRKGILRVSLEQIDCDRFLASHGHESGSGPYARLSVIDNGVGMTPELVKRIFEPYFTTKSQGEGSGLGLAMVHGIVKNHQGILNVESKPGCGTAFAVYLPVCGTAAQENVDGRVAANSTSLSARILLVDDESIIADMSERILVKLGHKVTAFTDSMEAVQAFREHHDQYDLIFTDVTMPKLTGLELANEVRAVRKDIPIILCTGYSESLDQKSLKALNIHRCVWKPVEFDELARIIQEALNASTTEEDLAA